MTWKPTKFRGVRYREHPTRKHGIMPDRYFVIRYQRKESGLKKNLAGLREGKWTAEKAAKLLAELKDA